MVWQLTWIQRISFLDCDRLLALLAFRVIVAFVISDDHGSQSLPSPYQVKWQSNETCTYM